MDTNLKDDKIEAKRSEGQKRYEQFLEAYREAHPELKRVTQYDRANGEWPKLKNDENLRNQRMIELKIKAQNSKANAKANFMSLFAKQKAKKTDDIQASTSSAVTFQSQEINVKVKDSDEIKIEKVVDKKTDEKEEIDNDLGLYFWSKVY